MSGRTKCVCGHDKADHSTVNGTGCAEFRGKSLCPCETFRPLAATPPDAVAQAREKYERCFLEARFAHEHQGPSELAAAVENLDCAWAEVLAAVRAECAADTKRLDWLQREHSGDTLPVAAIVVKVGYARRSSNWANVVGDIRATMDRAMEVAP